LFLKITIAETVSSVSFSLKSNRSGMNATRKYLPAPCLFIVEMIALFHDLFLSLHPHFQKAVLLKA